VLIRFSGLTIGFTVTFSIGCDGCSDDSGDGCDGGDRGGDGCDGGGGGGGGGGSGDCVSGSGGGGGGAGGVVAKISDSVRSKLITCSFLFSVGFSSAAANI
jgi:hypothetical protein